MRQLAAALRWLAATGSPEDMGTAPLGRVLLRLSIPGALGMVVMAFYNIVDTLWVSGLPHGPRAIAALTVAFPLQMIANALAAGMAIGIGSLVARRLGEQRLEQVSEIAGHAVTLPLLAGLVLFGVSQLWPNQLLALFGARPDILGHAREYMLAISYGFPCILVLMGLSGLYRGSGDAVTPMLLMMVSGLINLVLDPLLIYGVGPFPRLEVEWAGVATAFSQFVVFVAALWHLHSHHSGYELCPRHFRPHFGIVRDIAQVGAPASVMQFVFSVVVSLYNSVLGHYGSMAIAAYGLTFRILMMLLPWFMGVTQGLLPIAGYNFGARDYKRMWHAYRLAASWTAATGLLIGVLIQFVAPDLVAIFTRNDPQLQPLATLAVRIVLATMGFVAPQIMGVTMLQGMGLGTLAMVISLTRQVIFLIPCLLILSHSHGLVGAFAASPVADVLSFIATSLCLWRVHARYPASLRPQDRALDVAAD